MSKVFQLGSSVASVRFAQAERKKKQMQLSEQVESRKRKYTEQMLDIIRAKVGRDVQANKKFWPFCLVNSSFDDKAMQKVEYWLNSLLEHDFGIVSLGRICIPYADSAWSKQESEFLMSMYINGLDIKQVIDECSRQKQVVNLTVCN